MERGLLYPFLVGLLIYAIDAFLTPISEGPAVILFFLGGLLVGIAAASVKWGFVIAFVVTFLFQVALSLGSLSDPNTMAAVVLFSVINSAIVGVLGAAGGFIGRAVFKRTSPPAPAETTPPGA